MRIDEETFEMFLRGRMDDATWMRARFLFRNYGRSFRYMVTNIFLHALDKGKLDEVMPALEAYYERRLSHVHPDARENLLLPDGQNETTLVLERDVMDDILCIKRTNPGWPPAAVEYLEAFYEQHHAVTIEQKIAVHVSQQGECNIYCGANGPTREQVLAVYEDQLLIHMGLITPVYC